MIHGQRAYLIIGKIDYSRRQRGAGLLILLLIILGVAASLYVSRPVSQRGELNAATRTTKALANARQALLGYAAAYPELTLPTIGPGPGFLPCPDTDNDGNADPPCNNEGAGTIVIGRLPWQQLGIEDLRDAGSERLWYAVSSNFRNNPQVAVLNSDIATYANYTLNGTNDIAAVILAPGLSLTTQLGNRPSNTSSDYLEGDNALTNNKNFVSTLAGNFNDRILAISASDLINVMQQRAGLEMRRLLQDYYAACGYYPLAAPYNPAGTVFDSVAATYEGHFPIGDSSAGGSDNWDSGCAAGIAPPQWLGDHDWHRVSYYAVSPTHVNGGAGTCPCMVLQPDPSTDKQAVILLAGTDLGSGRPSSNITDYLEGENATTGDNTFEQQAAGPGFNDKAFFLPVP